MEGENTLDVLKRKCLTLTDPFDVLHIVALHSSKFTTDEIDGVLSRLPPLIEECSTPRLETAAQLMEKVHETDRFLKFLDLFPESRKAALLLRHLDQVGPQLAAKKVATKDDKARHAP